MVRTAPLILALPILLIAACGGRSDKAAQPPSTVAEAAWPGAEIKKNGDDLFITATLPKQASDDDYVGELGDLAKRTAEAIQAGAADYPPDVKTVSFLALRPDLDRLGNSGAHSFMTVTFNSSDLQTAHVDKLGAYGVLDLASLVQVVLPYNTAVDAWCLQHDRAPSFCALAKASVGPGI